MDNTYLEKEKIRYSIKIRLVELINIAVMTLSFVCVWFIYYKRISLETGRLFWTSMVIILIYLIIYWIMARVYKVFDIYTLRIQHMIYGNIIALALSDFIIYFAVSIADTRFPNVFPMMILFGTQCFISVAWALCAHRWYFKKFSAKRAVLIHDMDDGSIAKRFHSEEMQIRFNFVEEWHIDNFALEDIHKRLQNIEAVVISGISSDKRDEILKHCVSSFIEAYVIPYVGDILMSSVQKISMFHIPLLRVERFNPAPEYNIFKRFIDIVLSVSGLTICSPLMLIAVIAIKTNDKGPVLYRQQRLTKNGKIFMMIKFRTMSIDAESDGVARLSTGVNDTRITKPGKWLRASRIDELPQFINILKGDMSLVGPRPERPEIHEQYKRELPDFDLRLQVKAGLTGYAQVYGRYDTTPKDKLIMDLMYIARPNLAEDVRLVMATLKTAVLRDNVNGIEEGKVTASDK